MGGKRKWEYPSLEWIHRVRDEHYKKTKGLPVEAWLQPVNIEKAAQACRRLGLKIRVTLRAKRKAG